MRVLVYEDGLDDDTMCVYETNETEVMPYATEAYNGQHVDDIVWEWDGKQYCEVDFENNIICLDVGDAIHFDVAVNANDIE